MVTARMYLDTDGFYHKFDVSGHADGYTDDSEYDLVCAAISSITLTIASGLQDVLHKRGKFSFRERVLKCIPRFIQG